VSESPHGPILESLTDALGFTDLRGAGSITALDWAMRDQPTSAGVLALMPLAKNSQQLGDALFENDICPLVNNIICVDRHNDMHRYIATTLRHRSGSGANHAEQGVTGVVPLPGSNPDYDFRLSTAAELLVESNPLEKYTLTANNDTMGDSGSYPIHNFPTHDARAKRIDELLQKRGSNFTTAYFADMQLDLLDVRARELVPNILQSLKSQPQHERLETAIKLLSDWDYVATTDSKAACIFYPLLEKRSHIQFMETVLGKSPLITTMSSIAPALNRFDISHFMAEGSPWRAHRDTLDKIIADNVIAIVDYLTTNYADDWSWGKIHQIHFGHSLRKHKPWQAMQVGPDPIGGSATTLRMAQHNPPVKGSIEQEVYHGPAFRWIVDMADPLRFKFVIAGGNGGRPDSEYVSDHYTAWLKGDYFDMSLVREEMNIVRQDKASTTGAE
jgi:penicillin amidase